MAEAKRSILQIHTINITTAAHILAQLRARDAVKDRLRKQDLKVSHHATRDYHSDGLRISQRASQRSSTAWRGVLAIC
jgi:hypothetical protein